jgi:phosphosulfolactate phosphohydrolase-like enzyme
MNTRRRVRIDAPLEGPSRKPDGALVCVDVLLFSTSVVTSAATGRRTLAASTASGALRRAASLVRPLLAAEERTPFPPGFEPHCGPASLQQRTDVERPLVLVSPTARLLEEARGGREVYVACLRNLSATVSALVERHSNVVIMAAGDRGEVRCEDQVAAAWIARELLDRGFEAEDWPTVREVERWGSADLPVVKLGKGAEELRTRGHEDEVSFVLDHVNDLDFACVYVDGEVGPLTHVRQRLAV